ncbi:hypothetical protein BAG01nite_29170 [Brevibacillus agri]|uniref:Uncharacterized protein n=1 Tax=Brevibacillus agri TaxID=51101 RepID=A0ABQ0STX4_9BACL|nr:hypothetical protein BAG01nite_29170 [Brevibacillus agri]
MRACLLLEPDDADQRSKHDADFPQRHFSVFGTQSATVPFSRRSGTATADSYAQAPAVPAQAQAQARSR